MDFEFKTYSEYEDGFGQAAGEHWIGLRYMHIMTSQPRIVQVDEVENNGLWYFLKYSEFSVSHDGPIDFVTVFDNYWSQTISIYKIIVMFKVIAYNDQRKV